MRESTIRRRGTGAGAVALAALGLAAVPLSGAQVIDRVVAVVSGTVIMMSDARAAISLGLLDTGGAADPLEAATKGLIDRQLVLDEAGRGGRVDVDPAALGRAFDQARQRFASEEEYRRALEGLGLDDTGVRRLIRDTLTVRRYVEDRFDSVPPASDEELREYYATHADRFVRDNRRMSFEDALAEVAAAVQQERRAQAVSAWMDRLRRRADIREVYRSGR
ncbi:MAG: hypothetical protein R6V57_07745 [Vicinamibacterales bacterium]